RRARPLPPSGQAETTLVLAACARSQRCKSFLIDVFQSQPYEFRGGHPEIWHLDPGKNYILNIQEKRWRSRFEQLRKCVHAGRTSSYGLSPDGRKPALPKQQQRILLHRQV